MQARGNTLAGGRPAKTARAGLRSERFNVLRMAADLGGVRQQIEQELAKNVVGADPADVEEMLAILTASTRSYERKVAKAGGEPDIHEFISTLGNRYVADEGLLDAAQWNQVAQSVAAAVGQNGAQVNDSPLQAIRDVDESIKAGILALSISHDDKEEALAIVTTSCRSLARKAKNGQVSGDVKGQAMDMLYMRLVSEEGLLSTADWEAAASPGPIASSSPGPAAASMSVSPSSSVAAGMHSGQSCRCR